jgi:ATP-dependent Lon protease
LIPTAREESGLTEDQIRIERSAVEALARDYCREAGVRNLKRQLEKIFRKAALHVARSEESQEESKEFLPIVVSDETLESFVGKPVFSREKMYEAGTAPPGVALGLAWTQLGGRTLHIESVQVADRASRGTAAAKGKRSSSGESPGDGKMKVTGMLGEVMRESSDIAFSYVRSLLRKLEPDNKFFDTASVHVHVPDGGTPKDGPSAGCAMVTAMLSLARGISVSSDVALTGEISLTGKVLPVGGILSKVIAAKEAGVKHVVLPKGNVKDWEEIPEEVRDGIIVHFAVQYDEDVLPICFPTKPAVTNDGVELSGESERAETPRPSAATGG